MRAFGLTPDQVLARALGASMARPPGLGYCLVYGAVSFGLVSVLAYTLFAYRLIRNEPVLYAATALIYLGVGGLSLSRLVAGRGAAARVALLFAVSFLAYAVLWCAFWFGLKGRYLADLWGATAGLAAMTLLLQRAFGGANGFWSAFATLLALHSLGYYLGDALHAAVRGPTGRLLWGAAHGLGFGAGLGCVLYRCQAPLRARLPSTASAVQ